MKILFLDRSGKVLYEDDLDAIPRDGDVVILPSGRVTRVLGNPIFDLRESGPAWPTKPVKVTIK